MNGTAPISLLIVVIFLTWSYHVPYVYVIIPIYVYGYIHEICITYVFIFLYHLTYLIHNLVEICSSRICWWEIASIYIGVITVLPFIYDWTHSIILCLLFSQILLLSAFSLYLPYIFHCMDFTCVHFGYFFPWEETRGRWVAAALALWAATRTILFYAGRP